MASTGVKEYTLKINGVTIGIKEVTALEDAVKSLDAAVVKSNASALTAAKTATVKSKALTDEEKAAKKLEDTQKRLTQVSSEANRAQIEANIALREATREQTRQIAINQTAEGSIRQMGMTLTDLRNEYEELSAAERASEQQGGELLKRIQALDTEYKALRESTGNFRDSVGNYGKATEGLKRLSDDLKDAGQASVGLAASLLGSSRTLGFFGTGTDEVNEGLEDFNRLMIFAVGASSLYTAVTQEGIIADGIALVVSTTRTIQLKAQAAAQALATKGTVAATIAQTAFNIVASANPYILLATAIIAVGAALYAFTSDTDDAAESQEALNIQQSKYIELLALEGARIKDLGDKRVKEAERALELLQAQGVKTAELRKAEDKLFAERLQNNARQRGFNAEEIDALEENKKKLKELNATLALLNEEKEKGNTETSLLGVEDQDIEKAIKNIQAQVDNTGQNVEIAVTLTTEQAEIEQAAKVTAAARVTADKEANAQRLKDAAELHKTRRDLELTAIRELEDLQTAALDSEFERQTRATVAQYDRQIVDLKIYLAEEKNLTIAAREAINERIILLEAVKGQDLARLQKEQAARELETLQAAEDSRTALIAGQMERRTAEVNIVYDRQVDALFTRLETEKDLTEAQQMAITQMIVDAELKRGKELDAVTVENMERSAALQLRGAESALKSVRDKIGEVTARDKDGLQLIDVAKTLQNLEDVRAALGQYVQDVQAYQDDLTDAFNASTVGLDKNSIEYKEALQTYSDAMQNTTQQIQGALKEQERATQESTRVQIGYYQDLFQKIADWARLGAEAVFAVADALTMGIQFSIENLNAELDVINEQFEQAQAERERAVENVEALQERLQNATGGTAKAIQAQLLETTHAREEAEREEARLAREKEKRDAEIAKKEKQQRKVDLIGGIAQGIANTAEAVTKALTVAFPFNLVLAAIVGGAGAAQVGIMTKQLAKLEDGGIIDGPSHADGGVKLPGLGVEVEGGEFVVNKRSTAANEPILRMINSADGAVSLADLAGIFEPVPAVNADLQQSSQDRVLEAIENIEIRPVVSVVDITEAQQNITDVQDLSGFDD